MCILSGQTKTFQILFKAFPQCPGEEEERRESIRGKGVISAEVL